ncbi:MAG: TonB-dependent receptor [candidate division Zixibacteria bacterium]|nr:TonB-dependent receptor [candidate division Zixibacteria bacterium]
MFKHKLILYLLTAMVAALLLSSTAFAANIGKVSGRVVDRETGEGLPTVAVQLVGTNMGALTDVDGQYTILNVPVGEYDIKAELVGYQPVEKRGIYVSVDLTTYVDFELTSRAIDVGEVQIVQAERPLVIRDQTSTLRLVSGDEIQNLPTKDYQDVIGLSTGVVSSGDNIATRQRGGDETSNNPTLNIRGGRQNEVAYMVDGFDTKDPLTGLANLSINNNSIEEISITTGGFNAEYGWIASGAIQVTTKEGVRNYSGNVEAVTSSFTDDYGYNSYSVDITGPILPDNERLSFFLSGERRVEDDRDPHALNDGDRLPNNDLRGWTWQGKLRYDITPNFIARFGVLGSYDKFNRYARSYQFNQEHMAKFEDKNNSFYLQFTNNLSKNTFWNAKANYFQTSRFLGDGVFFDDPWAYASELNPNFNDTKLFWPGDDPETEEDEAHFFDDFTKRQSSYYGFEFDITSQVNAENELKFGLEYQRHTLRWIRHATPRRLYEGPDGGGLADMDNYGYDIIFDYDADSNIVGASIEELDDGWNAAKNPYTFAAYLQDKFEWEGLVVNAGLRFDYLNVNTDRLINDELPLDPFERGSDPNATEEEIQMAQELNLEDLEAAEAEQRISPRLGIGFPVTDKTVFHLYYGKFFQRPELQYLYTSYDYLEYMVREAPYYNPVGNPNLEPEETTAYEVGVTHQLGDNTRFDLTAYYKDIKNLTQVVNQPSFPNAFATYRNQDYGTVKGLEFAMKMRRTRNVAFDIAYSLQYANGTGSYATSQTNIAWTNTERPLRVAPLKFDQRHKITAIVDVRSGKGEGPKLGDFYPLEKTGVNAVFNVGSGLPYSPSEIFNEITLASVSPNPAAPINSRYGPWTYRLDLKANRRFSIANLDLDFYVWVLNLFDTENVISVYEGTGKPDDTGWLATEPGQVFIDTYPNQDPNYGNMNGQEQYEFRQKDPRNYDIPRMIRLGMRLSF